MGLAIRPGLGIRGRVEAQVRPLSTNNLGVEALVKGPGSGSDRLVVNGEAARAKPHVADHTTTE